MKNEREKENFCKKHVISEKTLQKYYEDETKVTGNKNLDDLLTQLGE